MKLTDNVPIKWEAAAWIPAYCFAHMVISAICKENLPFSRETTSNIIFIAGVALAVVFLIHAYRMPRNSALTSRYEEPQYYRSLIPQFEDDDNSGYVLHKRRKPN